MGRGVDDRGLSYISITVGRESDVIDVVRRLEEALGFTFVLSNSLWFFQDKIRQSLDSARNKTKGKQLELLFTRLQWRSWRDTRSDPGHDILVQSTAQKAQRDQWDKEDAQEAALKKQRATDYAARMDAQKKDDEAKGIIRDGNGNVLLNLYEIRHRGSDFASKLDASFEVYARSGFDDQYLRQVIFDYNGVLISQLMDLGEFNKFLMSESASRLGRFVTFTGGIERPNLTKAIESYDWMRSDAISQYKGGVASHIALDRLAMVESYCGHASGKLEKFYNESVSQANRIALALQIVQMAIPIGGSAAFVEMLCIQAASNFSYTVTNKIVNGSDQSWTAALTDAAVGSVRDTIMRTAVTKLVGKIPKINAAGGIPGEAMKLAVHTLTFQVAESMASFFKGATFGEALANLHRNLKSPEIWVGALVNHAANKGFGKYLDVPQPTAPPAKELPAGSGTRIKPQKTARKASKKPGAAVTVALMFGSAGHGAVKPAASKPDMAEIQKGRSSNESKPPAAVARPDYLDPGTKDKGLGSGTSATDKKSQKVDPLDRNTSNATAGPAKPVNADVAADQGASGQGPKTPTKTPKTPVALPPRRKGRDPDDLKTIYDDDEGVELTPAYGHVGFVKKANSEKYRYMPFGKYQTQKTGKDYEYYLKFENSDGILVRIYPDDLSISGKKINIEEYKHVKDPAPSEEVEELLIQSKNIMTPEIMRKIDQSNLHYHHMGDKFAQMMNYVEALAKYPESLDKVIYRCSDEATRLSYQFVLDNLHGIYGRGQLNKPKLLKLLDKVAIKIDRPLGVLPQDLD